MHQTQLETTCIHTGFLSTVMFNHVGKNPKFWQISPVARLNGEINRFPVFVMTGQGLRADNEKEISEFRAHSEKWKFICLDGMESRSVCNVCFGVAFSLETDKNMCLHAQMCSKSCDILVFMYVFACA